jgi:ABC-type multidrug transport system fused ATPase/permease subunit
VERGSALVLVGPSGSGKSTLLCCLNRLAEPTGGRVRFDGVDVRALDPRDLRRRAALVMQTPVLFEGSVRDNLRIRPVGTPGDFSDASLASAVGEVGLEAGLLLDEPTSALDPPNAALVVDTVSRLRERRRLTIVAVTHQTELVRRLGGCLLYLVLGKVLAYDRADGAVTDARLQAFLVGEQAAPATDRP